MSVSNVTNTSEESHSGGASHAAPSEAALFIITCILIGVSTQFFLKKVKVPYTALLLVFGLCIGLLQAAGPKTHAFTATLQMWMGIDPHLLLLIFLPTIGFSAALGQEPHLLRRNWGQILILAWPGVVVTFLMIGICGRYFFPYGWTWPQSLLFGAMLSATDPVAVVAVLHEVGADEKLSSVIDGESLVNDGSALVIFLVLQQFVQGASLSVGEIVVSFIRLALVGAALGLGFGIVTSFWLANIWNDPGLEIVLSLGAAYGCYFVAEELAGASGLLAVVVMGFSMSLLGGRHITNRIKVEMHAFWNVLEWLANTILFLWVGIALGFVLLEPADEGLKVQDVKFAHHLRPTDAGYAVVLYLWLLVARGASIFLFYPLLSTGRIGYPMTWKTALFMVWAGLRGAVGVAMSLFILLDPLIDDNEFKTHCLFFMALMAFSTVLINGTTAKYLLEWLGLLKMSPQQLDVLQYVLKEVDGIADATLATSHADDVLGPPDPRLVKRWSEVGAAAGLSPAHHRVLKRLQAMHSGGRHTKGSARTDAVVAAALEDEPRDRKLYEYRARLLNVVKASYADMYQHFEITTPGIRLLQEATDTALDQATGSAAATAGSKHQQHQQPARSGSKGHVVDAEAGCGLGCGLTDWRALLRVLESSTWSGRFSKAAGKLRLNTLQEALAQREVAAKLQLVSSFVAAHSIAQQVFNVHFSDRHAAAAADAAPAGSSNGKDGVHKQALGAGSVADTRNSDAEVAQQVLQESRMEADAALQYAHEVLLPQHPGLGRLLMSRHVAIQVLERQADFLANIEEAGLVRTEEVHAVQHKAAVRLERLQHQRAWNIINLEHQMAHKAATEVPPLAVSSTGCTSADTLQHLAATAGQHEQKRQSGAGDPQQQGEGSSGSGGTGSRRPGIMLEEMSQVKAGLRQRANRHK